MLSDCRWLAGVKGRLRNFVRVCGFFGSVPLVQLVCDYVSDILSLLQQQPHAELDLIKGILLCFISKCLNQLFNEQNIIFEELSRCSCLDNLARFSYECLIKIHDDHHQPPKFRLIHSNPSESISSSIPVQIKYGGYKTQKAAQIPVSGPSPNTHQATLNPFQ